MSFAFAASAQEENDSLQTAEPMKEQTLDEVVVGHRRLGTIRMAGPMNGTTIHQEELFKAACCNLGESFSTNPSVDVSYDDATTGARQIRLLGLSGTYVQMMGDNIPNWRGVSMPYALGYVPGPWMKSIQVSKGNASVKYGYESITGQINVQYLPAEDVENLTANVYGDSKSRMEGNLTGNIRLTDKLSTQLLTHYENRWGHHDENNDGFTDLPDIRQANIHNRWAYLGDKYIFHGGVGVLDEHRSSGQTAHHSAASMGHLWESAVETRRYEGFMKHAYILNKEHASNIAVVATASMHETKSSYGLKKYGINEKNVLAQMLYESNLSSLSSLSVGLSMNHDYLHQDVDNPQLDWWTCVGREAPAGGNAPLAAVERETSLGAFAQYTFDWKDKLVIQAGMRLDYRKWDIDYRNRHTSYDAQENAFLPLPTPRLHVKWMPAEWVSFRASAGFGYRMPFHLAEYNYLMASGRNLVLDLGQLGLEQAYNCGLSAQFTIPLWEKALRLNAEYYYTKFKAQTVVDYDADPSRILLYTNQASKGNGFSRVFQVDASYEVLNGLTMTAAYRRNIVKSRYGGLLNGTLRTKPLTSRYKGLVTASYKTPLGIWQFDATLQLNGGGRMPDPYLKEDGSMSWEKTFSAYEQVSLQVTRWFRRFSVYVGGENLTGFRQKHPVYGTDDPWGRDFEPTLVWGPVHGPMFYAGVRVYLERF